MIRWLALLGVLAACSGEPASGPGEVRWDRDACERCAMVVSDRRFAAQVRLAPSGELHKFDELGCALVWLDESGRAAREIWVRDHETQAWLDAEAAFYEPVRATPMDYGFGAIAAPGAARIPFAELRERILSGPRHPHAGDAAAR